MRILITGGCGFISANLIARLMTYGDPPQIVAFDNEVLGKREHIDGLGAEFVHGDIRNRDALKEVLSGTDVVVHLAADTRVMDSIENPEFNFDNNVIGTFELLMAMRDCGVNRIVNASTGGAILGEVTPPVHEDMVPRPLSPYGAAKLAAEGYLSAFAGSYGFQATSLRFANVYGPRSFHKGSVVAAFYRNILKGKPLIVHGDGSQTRDFVYVDDITDGIAKAIESGKSGAFQLGSGIGLSVNELIVSMRRVIGDAYPIIVNYEPARAGEILHTYCDVSKARREIGYVGETKLEEGLAETWRWFLAQ